MKIRTLITTAVLSVVLGTGTFQVNADQQRTFGFTGEVNSFNRSAGTLVVDDLVFHITDATLVHKKRGARGTLSDIAPGTRIGFYPATSRASTVNEIWVLPDNWKAAPGYARALDN
jgi:hypothetical protein